MAILAPSITLSPDHRRARVLLHCAEKFAWAPKDINAIEDTVIRAMYDVLWPSQTDTKTPEKPTTTTTTYPNATVTLTTTTHANPLPAGSRITWPTSGPYTYTWTSF